MTAQEAAGTQTGAWTAQPLIAGILAAIVGYASTFALVLAGLVAVGASPAQAGSGLFAACTVLGVLNLLVSWRTRTPISFAWTTPGLALMLSVGPVEGGFPAAVGAFLLAAALIVLAGLVQPVARAVAAIPSPIANAMLAGMLLPLCLSPLRAVETLPLQALTIIIVWALALRFARRYAVPLAVLATAIVLVSTTTLPPGTFDTALPHLLPVLPSLSFDAVMRLGLPLFVVTMASQNLPGLAVLKANGFEPRPAPLFVLTGVGSAVTAIFGGHSVNLAAITAAICAGPEAHPDPQRRWPAPLAVGLSYLVIALGAGFAAAFVAATPPILIEAVAGLALISSLAAALTAGLADEERRVPAVVTFVTTASGVTVLGVGGAFWGLVAGIVLSLLLRGTSGRK